jgi:hypothetical protein
MLGESVNMYVLSGFGRAMSPCAEHAHLFRLINRHSRVLGTSLFPLLLSFAAPLFNEIY